MDTGCLLKWAEIDTKAAYENILRIKKYTGGGTRILAVVKADAYSHGAVPMAKAFLDAGADFLGTADCGEAVQLRGAGVKSPLLVLNPPAPFQIKAMAEYDLCPVIDSVQTARRCSTATRGSIKKMRLHAEIDTGMGRAGFRPEEAPGMIRKIAGMPNIAIEGIFTHFPSAEDPQKKEFTEKQIHLFKKLVSLIENDGFHIPCRHASNSAGILNFPECNLNMVRPGLLLYGISPVKGKPAFTRRVLTLKTRIVHKRTVPPGTPLGYGGTFITRRKSEIATLPAGYADGYDRRLSETGEVLIRGRRAPIAGRISMDRCLVDITGLGAKTGEEAVLIGSQGSETITVEELAEKTGSIAHELISRLGYRIKKIYV